MGLLSLDEYNYKSWNKTFPKNKVDLESLYLTVEWDDFLKEVKEEEKYMKLKNFFEFELNKTKGNIDIFPYPKLVFNSFNYMSPENVKVVILGQDPYFNFDSNKPQAMGLSFSVPLGVKTPSSLVNIYKNLKKFGHIKDTPRHGNLESWANQGVLLLNTALTVQKGAPNSHAKKWEFFTDFIIKKLSKDYKNIVFVLWGGNALKKKDMIDSKKHRVFISSHPSGLSVNKPLRDYPSFESFDHFGEINNYLKSKKQSEILWNLL